MPPPKQTESLQGALELLILRTLALRPNHGFGISLHIQETSDSLLRVEEGSLYPALHRLEREGMVGAEWHRTENGRRARIYSLTPSGRKRLQEIQERWETLTQGVRKVLRFAQ